MATPPPDQSSSQSASGTSSTLSLTPTTERIVKECPRARILIVGRSAVGKSSLVNAIFKTSFADVQHHKAGKADINHEHISEHNERFVLHDSQGYEPGDDKKFQVLEDFIKAKTDPGKPVSERLLAIWLCLPVPFAGTRPEHGDEKIFKLNRGKVPIIVVFTKLDLLTAKVQVDNIVGDGGGDDDEIQKRVAELLDEGSAHFKQLTQEIPGEIPFVPVSIHQPETLQNLVQVTTRKIPPETPISRDASQGSSKDEQVRSPKHKPFLSMFKQKRRSATVTAATEGAESVRRQAMVPADDAVEAESIEDLSNSAQLALAMAQRISPPDKITASINVGKKKYWLAIASGAHFLNVNLSRCLNVIHTDIINVWNIRDMDEYFLADAFRGRMTAIVQDLSDCKDDNRPVQAALAVASAAAGIAVAIAPAVFTTPAGAVAAPVAAVVFLAAWALGIYQKTPDTIRCLMAYVVDLIVIMRAVFQASCENNDGILGRERVEDIINKYDKSATKTEIHHSIRGFVQGQFPFTRSTVVEKIEAMIKEDRNFIQ